MSLSCTVSVTVCRCARGL